MWCDSLGGDAIGLTWEKRDSKVTGSFNGEFTSSLVELTKKMLCSLSCYLESVEYLIPPYGIKCYS